MDWLAWARALFWVTGGLYALSCVLYLGFLSGFSARVARLARIVLAAGFVAHSAELSARGFAGLHPASSVNETLGFLSWLLVLAFLLVQLRRALDAVGAFVAPGALILLALAWLTPGPEGTTRGLGALGRIHISLAAVGIALFALATALAIAYLVQDRQLKHKRLGQLVKRGTGLEQLDRLMHRTVQAGFPVFTVAMVTGAAWSARSGQPLRLEYLAALIAWSAFAAALVARQAAGWRGRRSALLTVLGFCSAAVVLGVYLARAATGS